VKTPEQSPTWVGQVDWKQTVGYRSPWGLVVTDAATIARWTNETPQPASVRMELRGARNLFEAHRGKQVVVVGKRVVIEPQRAEPGSEAASRFVAPPGELPMIPGSIHIEVEAVGAR
jgi:hypothetical protein